MNFLLSLQQRSSVSLLVLFALQSHLRPTDIFSIWTGAFCLPRIVFLNIISNPLSQGDRFGAELLVRKQCAHTDNVRGLISNSFFFILTDARLTMGSSRTTKSHISSFIQLIKINTFITCETKTGE